MKWYTIAPINPSYNNRTVRFTKPLDLGFGVSFITVPDWLNKLEGLDKLGFNSTQLLKEAAYMLVSEYEANSLGDPDLEWKGNTLRSKQDTTLEKIQIVNLALWLTKPSWLGFKMALHVFERDGYKTWQQYLPVPPVIPNERDDCNYLEIADFENGHKVNSMLQQLNRGSSIWIAARTLWNAVTTGAGEWEVRFLLFWIVLEALFGTKIEVTYRISHRIAFFLSSSREEAGVLYQKAKTAYRWRSNVVHGMKLDRSEQKKEESRKILSNTEIFTRKALLKILSNSELITLFCSDRSREKYLDNLAFSDLSK